MFSVYNSTDYGGSGQDFVTYCFAPVEGYSAFGSYTGNGSADGPFVYTGFRPRWVLWRASSTTGNWILIDTVRDAYNVSNARLFPNLSNAEQANANGNIDVLSNGFKFRNTTADNNANGVTHIYAAFAENPFSLARAR